MRFFQHNPKPTTVALAHLKASLPFRATLIRIKRGVQPYTTNPDNDALALQQGLQQIRLLETHYGGLADKVVLEMGTGWQPTIPVLLSLLGCRQIILTDVERLMDYATLVAAMSFVCENREQIAAALGIPSDDIARSLGRALASNVEDFLANLRMDYAAPYDVADFKSQSIDVIYSRAVLEHVPPEDLKNLLTAQRRILKSGGASCHIIDNSDHWEHSDKTLSRINYLRYEPLFWSLINSSGQAYQNRLRHSDYKSLFDGCGYELLFEDTDVDAGALKDASSISLAARFRNLATTDLAAVTSYLIYTSP